MRYFVIGAADAGVAVTGGGAGFGFRRTPFSSTAAAGAFGATAGGGGTAVIVARATMHWVGSVRLNWRQFQSDRS